MAANGERVVDTDISGSDAFAKDGYAVASSIASQAQAGSIIVLHLNGAPNAGTTATIVQNLVPALKGAGPAAGDAVADARLEAPPTTRHNGRMTVAEA